MEKVIAGKTIHVNEEGFMTDFKEWDNTVGEALAAENEINLSPRHWEVLGYLQTEFKNEVPSASGRSVKAGWWISRNSISSSRKPH